MKSLSVLSHTTARWLMGLALVLVSWAASAQPFSKIYIFGDSLSDNGNLASVSQPFPNPPFFGNRVTNGKVAVELLAEQLGVQAAPSLHLIGAAQGTNYSVAGAKAGTDEPIDLNTQVNAFLLNHGGVAPADALYLVFIGGNDVRAARDEANLQTALSGLFNASAAVDKQIRALIGAGARSLLVVNVPDIGSIPETLLKAKLTNDPFLPTLTSLKTSLFNQDLANRVRRIERDTQLDLVLFDLNRLFADIIRDARAYGYSNTTEPCFSQQSQSFTSGCQYGAKFGEYVFFDEIHPTAKTHQRASRALFAAAPVLQ